MEMGANYDKKVLGHSIREVHEHIGKMRWVTVPNDMGLEVVANEEGHCSHLIVRNEGVSTWALYTDGELHEERFGDKGEVIAFLALQDLRLENPPDPQELLDMDPQ